LHTVLRNSYKKKKQQSKKITIYKKKQPNQIYLDMMFNIFTNMCLVSKYDCFTLSNLWVMKENV